MTDDDDDQKGLENEKQKGEKEWNNKKRRNI